MAAATADDVIFVALTILLAIALTVALLLWRRATSTERR